MPKMMSWSFSRWLTPCLLACGLLIAGCSEQPDATVVEFEPNLVHAMKHQIKSDQPMKQAAYDARWVANKMFGTPDEPKIPEFISEDDDFSSLLDMNRLMLASGPDVEGRGLYRKHCSMCHGVTGNGRGPNAAIQNPYPRDYRMGTFKFKTTPRGSKPTREDLARLIRHGIDGTSMKPIPGMTEEGVQALVDYVIYLSLRGELERALMDDAVFELDMASGDRIVNPEFADSEDEEEKELYEDQIAISEEFTLEIADAWLAAEDEVIEVPEPPSDLPVADSYEQFVEMSKGEQADKLAESVKRGQALFVGKIASCSKCHGEKGLGDGQTTDYDEWTKDWTDRAGLKPDDRDALIPLMARGALPPLNARPRNFAEGIFRGGSTASDLYLRIMQGIDGTPMPAATFVEGQFEQDDVWHLINFIRSLQTAPTVTPPPVETATEPADKTAINDQDFDSSASKFASK